jgi:hypothetical protein
LISDTWSNSVWHGSPFSGFADLLDGFSAHVDWPTLEELETSWLTQREVRAASGELLRLIAQPAKTRRSRSKDRGHLYDVMVCQGEVPTRSNNWHDFFNVMMFAAFPIGKRVLHSSHRDIIEQRLPRQIERLPGARTAQQDGLTMLDEGGVLLAVEANALQQLEACLDAGSHGDLLDLSRRGLIRPWLFGHAHLELVAKQRALGLRTELARAKPVVLPCGAGATRAQIDAAFAASIAQFDADAPCHRRRAIAIRDLFVL